MSDDNRQGELWKVDRKFVKVLFSTIDEMEIADLGTSAFAVLTVIQRFTYIQGVTAQPSLAKLCTHTGLTKPTVRSAISLLIKKGYLEQLSPKGAKLVWRVRQKYVATATEDNPQVKPGTKMSIPTDYNVSAQDRINKLLAQFEKTGKFPKNQSLIHIDNITIHQYNLGDGSTVQNVTVTPGKEDLKREVLTNLPKDPQMAERINKLIDDQVDEVVDTVTKNLIPETHQKK